MHYKRWLAATPASKRPAPRASVRWYDLTRAAKAFDLSTPELAYFFGFLQADGTHAGQCSTKGSISIELSSVDADILHSFKELIPYPSSISHRSRTTNFTGSAHTTTTWTLCSREARLMLACLGLPPGKKSRTIAPPSMAFSRRDYMRGLVDADGSVGVTATGLPFISFTTASPEMIKFFCGAVFDVTGQRRTVNPNTRDGLYNFMLMREAAVALISWLYYDGCLALQRKYAKAKQASRWERPAGMKVGPPRKAWTAEQDRIVQEMTVSEAARALGRTEDSVRLRRWRLRRASGPV